MLHWLQAVMLISVQTEKTCVRLSSHDGVLRRHARHSATTTALG